MPIYLSIPATASLLTVGAPETGEKLLRFLPLILIVMAVGIIAIVLLRKNGAKHHDDED